jgi:ubiquinone/menaquinone biosynthesis C-methylase UbiE
MKQISSEQKFIGYFRENGYVCKKGVWYAQSPDANSPAERLYYLLRNKEGWIYPDEIVRQLPDVNVSDKHSRQWRVRKRSWLKLLKYLKKAHPQGSLLDVGSGNGWMTNALAESGFSVCGLDLNFWELEQAARVFDNTKSAVWLYGDIFQHVLPPDSMDAVILASSIQYFKNVGPLLKTLFQTLHSGGEIHIIDTPFYSDHDKKDAVHRSQEYYTALGYPEFAVHYHHKTYEELAPYPYSLQYNPKSFNNVVQRLIERDGNRFPWIIIKKG